MYTYELIDQPTQLIRMFCFGRFLIDHQFDQLHPKLAEMEHDQAELIQVLAKAIKEALAKGWKLKQR
jgi:glycerol kinase